MNRLKSLVRKGVQAFEADTLNTARKFKSLEARRMYLGRLNILGNTMAMIGLLALTAFLFLITFTGQKLAISLLTMMFGLLYIVIGSAVSETTINAADRLFGDQND